jgi:ribosomal protein L16/L10AE
MGKGKGKLSNWVSNVSPGINIFELRNLRTGRAMYFLKQIIYRLPTKTEVVARYNTKVPLIFMKSVSVTEEFFW